MGSFKAHSYQWLLLSSLSNDEKRIYISYSFVNTAVALNNTLLLGPTPRLIKDIRVDLIYDRNFEIGQYLVQNSKWYRMRTARPP